MEQLLQQHDFILFKIPGCVNCTKLSGLFDDMGLSSRYTVINIADLDQDQEDAVDFLQRKTNSRTFPMIFINNVYLGDYHEVRRKIDFGLFHDILKKELDICIEIDV